jgi:xylulokinase
VLEGLAFAERDVVDRLAALGLPTSRVLVLGGGSRSATWTQIRADALGRPHDVAARAQDACAIGAAMIAAVAVQLQPDLTAAARTVPAPVATMLPRASLDAAYERYRTLHQQLASLAERPWATVGE